MIVLPRRRVRRRKPWGLWTWLFFALVVFDLLGVGVTIVLARLVPVELVFTVWFCAGFWYVWGQFQEHRRRDEDA